MLTPTTARVAHAALDYLTERIGTARSGLDGEWRNTDVLEAMIRTASDISITVPHMDTIVATAPRNHNGRIWAYLGGDALRHAAQTAAVGARTITRVDDYTFVLTFTA